MKKLLIHTRNPQILLWLLVGRFRSVMCIQEIRPLQLIKFISISILTALNRFPLIICSGARVGRATARDVYQWQSHSPIPPQPGGALVM